MPGQSSGICRGTSSLGGIIKLGMGVLAVRKATSGDLWPPCAKDAKAVAARFEKKVSYNWNVSRNKSNKVWSSLHRKIVTGTLSWS